jgi:hypothetical protein
LIIQIDVCLPTIKLTQGYIPAEDEIKELYDIYTGTPVAAPAPSDSSTDSLFGPNEYG